MREMLILLMCACLAASCQSNDVRASGKDRNLQWVKDAHKAVLNTIEGSETDALYSLRSIIPRGASKRDIDKVFRGFTQEPHIDVAAGIGVAEYRKAFYRISYSSNGHVFTMDYRAIGGDQGDDIYCGIIEHYIRRPVNTGNK